MKAIVPLSGGIDSAVVLAGCIGSDFECATVAFDYGQPHRIELQYAARLAEHYGVPHEVVKLQTIPLVSEVVFAGRNLVFASIAIAMAHARGFDVVAFGCNESDWFEFPDCRPPFWAAIEACAGAYGVTVKTPLIHNPKTDVIKLALKLRVPLELTWSCYQPQGKSPCRKCLACRTRDVAIAQVKEGHP